MPKFTLSPGKPDLIRGTLEGLALPFRRGQQAGLLAADVDAGERAVAELGQEVRDALAADRRGETEEVHVAGLRDRVGQVEVAVPAGLALAEQQAAAGQVEHAGAELLAVRVHQVVGQGGQRERGLDRRARRIGAAQRAIEQRLVDVVGQRRVLAAGEAAREAGRVEPRLAGQRQHVAGIRVDRDHGAAVIAEPVLGGLLGLQVQREHQVFAGDRRQRVQLRSVRPLALHRAALGVHQDLAKAVLAVQFAFERTLDAELADQRGAGIAAAVDVLEVLLADRADVAERVHAELRRAGNGASAASPGRRPGTHSGAPRSDRSPRR